MIDAGTVLLPIKFGSDELMNLSPEEYQQAEAWLLSGRAQVWRHENPRGYTVESPTPVITRLGETVTVGFDYGRPWRPTDMPPETLHFYYTARRR